MEQQTVLLTGFGPFHDHPVNASWEIVKEIKQLWSNEVVNLEIREIPVVYSEVSSRVPNLYGELRPSLCVDPLRRERIRDSNARESRNEQWIPDSGRRWIDPASQSVCSGRARLYQD